MVAIDPDNKVLLETECMIETYFQRLSKCKGHLIRPSPMQSPGTA